MKKPIFAALSLLLLTSCVTETYRNPLSAEIEAGYRTLGESTLTDDNVFYLNEDIFIRIYLNDYYCAGCIFGFAEIGSFVFTFEFLEEQTPPTKIGGVRVPPIANSDPNKKSYALLNEEFLRKANSKSSFVDFHFIATKTGNINYIVELRENPSVSFEGVIFVRDNS
jgi:hypothetical protein